MLSVGNDTKSRDDLPIKFKGEFLYDYFLNFFSIVLYLFPNFPGILLEEKLSSLLKFIKNFAWILINENKKKKKYKS